jgi:peptidyl-prolyl cis-trans isomerase C
VWAPAAFGATPSSGKSSAKSSTKSSTKSGKSGKTKAGSDSVLVRVGKETITTGQFQRRLDELPDHVRPQFTTPDGRQRLLDRMVEEKVWLMAATKKGVDKRPDVLRQIEQQRRDVLIRTYINEVMANNVPPGDSEALGYYDAHKSEYATPATVSISHIETKSESQAKKVRGWAKTQDWNKLAAKYSTDSLTKDHGGVLGPVTREGIFGQLGKQPALAESAFALGEGKIGGPYQTTDHEWHVIRVDSVKPAGYRPFDQVRGGIIRQMSSKQSQDYYLAKYDEAKGMLGVQADSAAIKKFLSLKRSARDMFNDAQTAGGPNERIDAYRKVLDQYPNSDVSPQAQFMIGFIQSEELKDFDSADRSFRLVLEHYPNSELAASAKWMVDHMRSETAPGFMNLESDSTKAAHGAPPSSGRKP